MTEITTVEIKVIVIQMIFMAIIGVFWLLFIEQPITTTTASGVATPSTVASAGDQSWISSLISLPGGMSDIAIVTALVITPFLLFDAFIALRFAKDIVTQWV